MLIVFDMDGVFIKERSSWKLIHNAYGIDNRDLIELYKKGKINDQEFIDKDIERWRLKGLKRKDILKVLNEVKLTPGSKECIKFFKERGETAIISGGIDILAKRIAKFGIDYIFANGIEFKEDIPIRGILRVPPKNKKIVLKNLMEKLGIKKDEVIVVGDTKYDLCVFKLAKYKIAFNSDEILERYADFSVKKRDLKELIKIGKYIFNF